MSQISYHLWHSTWDPTHWYITPALYSYNIAGLEKSNLTGHVLYRPVVIHNQLLYLGRSWVQNLIYLSASSVYY